MVNSDVIHYPSRISEIGEWALWNITIKWQGFQRAGEKLLQLLETNPDMINYLK